MKKVIRLTESELKNIIEKSVKKTLRENYEAPYYHAPLNRFAVVPKNGSSKDAKYFDTEEEACAIFNDGMVMYCSQDGGRTWMRTR